MDLRNSNGIELRNFYFTTVLVSFNDFIKNLNLGLSSKKSVGR